MSHSIQSKLAKKNLHTFIRVCVNICMCVYISLTVSVCLLVVVLDCAVVDFPPARIIRPVCNLNIIMRFFDICVCCAWCLEWHVTFSPATKSIEIVNVHVRSCSRSLFPHISFAFTFTFRFVCWFVLPLSGNSGLPSVRGPGLPHQRNSIAISPSDSSSYTVAHLSPSSAGQDYA